MMRASALLSNAVVRKDLRIRMRGWRWAGVITLYVAVLGGVALAFLLQNYNPSPGTSSKAGIDYFQALCIFQILLIVFVTPASMAGAISGERQNRTWDLLLLSRLSARDIVWGKFLSGIAFNLLLIAASMPFFALVFLFGGVGLGDVLRAFDVFLITVLLLAAVALAVSGLTTRLVVSFMVSMFISLLLAIGLSLSVVYLQEPSQPSVLTLGNIPFQTVNSPAPLSPLAQIDPLIAEISTLPADGGGTLLGDLGTVNHAFGLPWRLPLWGAYTLLAALISFVLLCVSTICARSSDAWRPRKGWMPVRRKV